MKNKGAIIFLSVAITAICLFSLSFTYMSNKIDTEIAEHGEAKVTQARAANESVDLDSLRKTSMRAYRDSLWKKEVYLGYTFQEVKQWSLNLGLDLQGGIHATLIVSPVEILKAMSDNSQDEDFLAAIDEAKKAQKTTQEKFTKLFLNAFQARKGKDKMAEIFVNVDNKFEINPNSTDDEIIKIINGELDDAIDRSLIVLRSRIDKFGTASPIIQAVKSTGRIEVQLPGADDQENIAYQLKAVAKLEFCEVWSIDESYPFIQKINQYLIEQGETEEGKDTPTQATPGSDEEGLFAAEGDTTVKSEKTEDKLFADTETAENDKSATDSNALAQENFLKDNPIFNYLQIDPQSGRIFARVQDYEKIEGLFKRKAVQALLPEDMTFAWADRSGVGSDGGVVEIYVLKKGEYAEAPLTGEVIVDAYSSMDDRGRPSVGMDMNVEGAKKWKKLTEDNIGKQVAVTLDNVVFSAPVVNTAIPNGKSVISGSFDMEQTKVLARILKAGRLPAPMDIERMVVVGPSLGQAAIDRGLLSLVAGLVFVVLFMVLYYNKGGLVADIALLFNIFFILGLLAQKGVGAALTLPGIAGIVLTMGMAIDANVLIFERIREELAAGKPLRVAIDNGYSRAFWSIFDSNVTTLMIALILAYFGSGLVKGFAVTLGIGIVSSFFSAVFITRLIIEFLVKRNGEKGISFDTVISKKLFKNPHHDFMGKRKVAYLASGVVIIAGLGLMFTQGLNLGVAFQGGHSYIVKFGGDVSATKVKAELNKAFTDASTEVKSFDGNDQIQITTSYMITSEVENADELVKAKLMEGLAPYNDLKPEIVQTIVVGPTIADDIKTTSLESIIIALIGIFIYIVFRFRKIGFGIGAFVSLLHDILMVLSVFAIARALGFSFEIDEVFIAAMLTIVGYSINDTVVVFDRVREYMSGSTSKNTSKAEMSIILNNSINGTLSRTLMTSFTTLLVVGILLVFGGEALRGFSFALFMGIFIGTYSSVFIATPLVLDVTTTDKKDEE